MPEHEISLDEVVKTLSAGQQLGKTSGIILLAEGAGRAGDLKDELIKRTGMAVKSTVLGYIQRGGSPSCRDRYLGTAWGVHAVQLLQKGIGNRICGIKNNKIYDMDIVEGCAMKKKFDLELYNMASIVSR